MRLPKTVQIVTYDKTYDELGIESGVTETVIDKFQADVQPFSSTLAEKQYGTTVKVTNRMFCKPNSNLNLGCTVKCNSIKYKVNSLLDFEKHLEVLLELIS